MPFDLNTVVLQHLPTLFKQTSAGGVQMWRIWVEPQTSGSARIIRQYGLVDGKQQEQTDEIREGKNAGKKNATTPFQQACNEAEAEWTKQRDRKCYSEDPTGAESAAKRALAPMLAYVYADVAAKVDWTTAFGQPKLDGHRCLARRDGDQISLTSREGKAIVTMDHIVDALRSVLKSGESLDGELWVPGLAFEQIASAIKRKQDLSEQIQYHVYDSPMPGSFEQRFMDRSDRVDDVGGSLVAVRTRVMAGPDELLQFQANCVADGYEGAMLRHGTGPYDAGKRSKALLKVKQFQSAEFEIVGVMQGRGNHAEMAIFRCQTATGETFDVTAPGTHEEKKQAWGQRAQMIGRKLTVKYFEMTSSEQSVPRFPVAERIHETV